MPRRSAVVLLVAFTSATGCASSLRSTSKTDDPGIEKLIALRFASDARLCPYEITPLVTNRTARLEGKVSSDADRRRAEKVARDAGATGVDDRLIVDPAAGEAGRC